MERPEYEATLPLVKINLHLSPPAILLLCIHGYLESTLFFRTMHKIIPQMDKMSAPKTIATLPTTSPMISLVSTSLGMTTFLDTAGVSRTPSSSVEKIREPGYEATRNGAVGVTVSMTVGVTNCKVSSRTV